METIKTKPTYEQLEKALHDAYVSMESMNMANTFKRADYLLEVIKNSDKFNSEFVVACTEEFESFITIKESE